MLIDIIFNGKHTRLFSKADEIKTCIMPGYSLAFLFEFFKYFGID